MKLYIADGEEERNVHTHSWGASVESWGGGGFSASVLIIGPSGVRNAASIAAASSSSRNSSEASSGIVVMSSIGGSSFPFSSPKWFSIIGSELSPGRATSSMSESMPCPCQSLHHYFCSSPLLSFFSKCNYKTCSFTK